MELKARDIEFARPINLLEEEKAKKEFESKQPEVSLTDAFSAAFAEDNTMSWIYNQLETHEPNPDFLLDEESYKEFTKDIPLEYHGFLEDAVSRPHAEKLRERVLQSMENEKTLANYGYGAIPIRLAAATLDPSAILATVLTEGVAAPLIWGNKATRLARAFRGVLTGGTSSAAIEAYLVSQNPIKDPHDILYAFGGGSLLGGAFGGAFGKSSQEAYNKAFVKIVKDNENAQIQGYKTDMIDKGIAKEEDFVDTKGVGAAENPMSPATQEGELRRTAEMEQFEAEDTPYASFGFLRFDMIGRLKSSTLGMSRKLASIYGEDAVDGGVFSADLIKTKFTRTYSVRFYNVYEDAYTNWAKSKNIGYFKRKWGVQRSEFGRLVADEIENPGVIRDVNITNAANRQRLLFKEMLQEAKRTGVKGFDDIPEDLRYFTHLWDEAKYTEMRVKYSDKTFIPKLLSQSLVRANPDLSPELALKMGTGMARNIERRGLGMDAGVSRIFSTNNRDFLKDLLIEEEILDEVDAERLVALLHFKPEGVSKRAKKRLKFDVDHTEVDIKTGDIVSVKDLMNRDAEQVFNSYVNQMGGRVAFATKGIMSDADHKKNMDIITDEGARLGQKGIKQAEKDVLKFNVMYDMILGRPPKDMIANPTSNANRMARLLMDYNFFRVMNQVGFAQIAELGNALSMDGVRGLMRVIPDLKNLITRTRNGELQDAVGRDLEAFMGIGVDRRIHQSMNRYDAHDILSQGRGDFLDKIGAAAQPIKRMTADISGMAPITAALERASGRIAVQNLTDLAFGIKKINFKKIGKSSLEQDIAARMESLGLNAEMAQRVFSQIREKAVTSPSVFFKGRKIKRINMDAWDDIEARDAFALAVSRWTRQSIQQNDVGNLNIHMTGTIGKILTQFRTFMLVSWAKQFLHNLNRNDFAAYSAMMYSTLFAGLSYTAQMHANAIGRSDKKEFLAERLSVEEIAKASFQRNSWMSLFPAVLDTGAPFFGEDPMFAYGRSTGLATGFISGIPSVQLFDTGIRGAVGLSRSIFNDNYQFSQSQARALQSLLPLQNAIGIKNVMNIMLEDLPLESKIDF